MAAIYQQARPQTFEQVVGQEHVKEVLQAALQHGRTGHAYLFSGPRGVGKTTTARLLAMALNCEAAGAKPCGQCESCLAVREGGHPDVIELDAASNNSVEDIRELRERTTLASMRGGARVWILDEAHMLSKAAANALLKTLEEPPAGLVFILATTEPEKLPPTVLSRCQHFRFRRLSEAEILRKLQTICASAGVDAQEEALQLVAAAADGAMRDAESLLERLLAPGTAITRSDAEAALGLPPRHRIERLAQAVTESDMGRVFEEAHSLYWDGYAPRSLAENVTAALRDELRALVTGKASGRDPAQEARLLQLIRVLDDEQERFVRRDDLYSLEVALLKAIAGTAAPRKEAGFDEVQVREPASQGAPETGPARTRQPAPQPAAAATDLPPFDPTGRSAPAPVTTQDAPSAPRTGQPQANAPREPQAAPKLDWHRIKGRANPQLKAFLAPARETVEGNQIIIRYRDTHRFHFNQLKARQDELARLIEEVAGPGFEFRIEGPGDTAVKKP